jgi:hypothetical protein
MKIEAIDQHVSSIREPHFPPADSTARKQFDELRAFSDTLQTMQTEENKPLFSDRFFSYLKIAAPVAAVVIGVLAFTPLAQMGLIFYAVAAAVAAGALLGPAGMALHTVFAHDGRQTDFIRRRMESEYRLLYDQLSSVVEETRKQRGVMDSLQKQPLDTFIEAWDANRPEPTEMPTDIPNQHCHILTDGSLQEGKV